MKDTNEDPLATPSQSPSLISLRSTETTSTPRQRNTNQQSSPPLSAHRTVAIQTSLDPPQSSVLQEIIPATRMKDLGLPKPRQPAKCNLFCCFYAEFDIQVGPKICFQSPSSFMDLPIGVSTTRVHVILHETFQRLLHPQNHAANISGNPSDDKRGQHSTTSQSSSQNDNVPEDRFEFSSNSIPEMDEARNTQVGVESKDPITQKYEPEQQVSPNDELSIFDSCSEYIITGNELTDSIINLSTHAFHVISQPTNIADARYERNSLFFSVGFILRRSADPRLYRPILSKWAHTLREMEIESEYLSSRPGREDLQSHLERLLISLNSPSRECSLLLSPAHVLHLKLFHPPRVPATPVPDYAVPMLLLRDWRHCQATYDWDLSIDWCARHIDGVSTAKQISQRAEVDMEIVRACLRVLRHHGVIALCDIFSYSNFYEGTERAGRMYAGQEPQLLMLAAEHAIRFVGTNSREGSPSLNPTPQSPGGTEGSSGSHGRPNEPGALETFRSMLSSVGSELSFMTTKQEDYQLVKRAVAEFYVSANRQLTFGETWLGFVAAAEPSTAFPRSSKIPWRRMFDLLDHRRLASFGVVHGLLRRVHRHPILLGDKRGIAGISSVDEKAGQIHIPSTPSVQDRPNRHLPRNQSHENKRKVLTVSEVAPFLDGRHCDDELVCEFERPLSEILELFEGKITFLMAPAPKM